MITQRGPRGTRNTEKRLLRCNLEKRDVPFPSHCPSHESLCEVGDPQTLEPKAPSDSSPSESEMKGFVAVSQEHDFGAGLAWV